MRRQFLKSTTRLGLMFTIFSLAACSGETSDSSADVAAPEILKWIQSDTEALQVLSEEPRECLPPAPNDQTTLGRLAFRSPFLLGGQAARRGLTCQACHGQGQINSHFFVVGLSNEPGTADVTSFHFSDVLGDDVFNPVPIPSLSDNIQGVDYSPESKTLEAFVKRLITKEFTGPEPTPEVETALLSYLRALDDTHCPSPTIKGRENLDFKLRIIASSLNALSTETLSPESHNFMLAALRVELGRLHDRFPNHPKLRARLITLSADLNSAKVETPNIEKAIVDWEVLEGNLQQAYESSLFDLDAIEKWIGTR